MQISDEYLDTQVIQPYLIEAEEENEEILLPLRMIKQV
jgi:hypothetical protein